MKKFQLTIVVEADDSVKPYEFNLYDHDVCDGFEVLLPQKDHFRISGFSLKEVIQLKPVSKEDIQDVAMNLLDMTLTEEELNWVMLSYEDAQRQDPTATWNLIVEDLLHQLSNNFEG